MQVEFSSFLFCIVTNLPHLAQKDEDFNEFCITDLKWF